MRFVIRLPDHEAGHALLIEHDEHLRRTPVAIHGLCNEHIYVDRRRFGSVHARRLSCRRPQARLHRDP